MLSYYSVSSIFIFNSSKVGWRNTLDKAISAKSHGEEYMMDISHILRKLL